METKKQAWEKPQLIILARGTPEESVLAHCKRIDADFASLPYVAGQVGCDAAESQAGKCGACQARASS